MPVEFRDAMAAPPTSLEEPRRPSDSYSLIRTHHTREGASARTAASEFKATTTCKQRLPGPVALMHLARDRRLEMKDAAWL